MRCLRTTDRCRTDEPHGIVAFEKYPAKTKKVPVRLLQYVPPTAQVIAFPNYRIKRRVEFTAGRIVEVAQSYDAAA
jgi:hypothetical protein